MDSLHYNCGRLGCTRGLLHVFCKNDKGQVITISRNGEILI